MAKNSKRRGRPPGSKNKKNGRIAKMDLGQLQDHITQLQRLLARKIGEQRTALERQLAALSDAAGTPRRGRPPKAARTATRRKAVPKYRSKKKPSLKWSGRGMTPIWMREEMKGTKLTKDDFLIK
jgi:DNA-binding protein H-NS